MSPARVYWITGLAGSGKTTLARLLHVQLRAQGRPAVLLDGDAIREILGETGSYDLDGRRRVAMRISHLCHWLSGQGIPVVCATISMFHACRAWNRTHIEAYTEIFLDVAMDELLRRDQKGLYSAARRGEIKDVMGVDLVPEWPESPDVVLRYEDGLTPEALLARLLAQLPSD